MVSYEFKIKFIFYFFWIIIVHLKPIIVGIVLINIQFDWD